MRYKVLPPEFVATAQTGAGDADQAGRAGLEVADEYVGGVIRVVSYYVGSIATENDVAAIGVSVVSRNDRPWRRDGRP